MKNRIKDKLRSRTGASITYALLIFLVCAVVGSAVLVAGTTAAGRMSEIAEYDQRYYAVTSAARLLIDLIDGNTVTIIKRDDSRVSPSVSYYYLDGSGAEHSITPGATFDSIPIQTSYQLMSNGNPNNVFYLTTSNAVINDIIKLDITETVVPGVSNPKYGEMTIKISKTTGTSPNSRVYSIDLIFNLDYNVLPPDTENVTDSNGSIIATVTTTTGTYTWHLRDIRVDGSQRWT